MLCLSRHLGERIALSWRGNLLGYIEVVEVNGDKVRLGFTMPKEIRIDRDEMQTVQAAPDPALLRTQGRDDES